MLTKNGKQPYLLVNTHCHKVSLRKDRHHALSCHSRRPRYLVIVVGNRWPHLCMPARTTPIRCDHRHRCRNVTWQRRLQLPPLRGLQEGTLSDQGRCECTGGSRWPSGQYLELRTCGVCANAPHSTVCRHDDGEVGSRSGVDGGANDTDMTSALCR